MKKKLLSLLTLVFLLTLAPLKLGLCSNWYPYVKLEPSTFTWKEFDDQGNLLLKEQGSALFLGIGIWNEIVPRWILHSQLEIFLAPNVKYQGHTMSGIPVTTTNKWLGVSLETLGGVNFPIFDNKLNLSILGGVGDFTWLRSISTTTLSNGTVVYGYTEHWENVYLKVESKLSFLIISKLKFSFEGGMLYPIFVSNEAKLPGMLDTSQVYPKGTLSPFFQVALSSSNFKLGLSYVKFSFKKSSPDTVTSVSGDLYLIWQPDSTFSILKAFIEVYF